MIQGENIRANFVKPLNKVELNKLDVLTLKSKDYLATYLTT